MIATGGWPRQPEMPGIELTKSSNEIFDLDVLPKRLLVVGGGYIAVEFALNFLQVSAWTPPYRIEAQIF